MPLSKPETPFQIVPDLLHDARINYKPWLACIFSIAASQCRTQFDSGCLFMVMTDAEYAAFSLHVDASGNAIQRPTVVPPKLPPLMPLPCSVTSIPGLSHTTRLGLQYELNCWPRPLNLVVRGHYICVSTRVNGFARSAAWLFTPHSSCPSCSHQEGTRNRDRSRPFSNEGRIAGEVGLTSQLPQPCRPLRWLTGLRAAVIHLEEAIAPTALFALFKETFTHHPSFLSSMGRFFETHPLRTTPSPTSLPTSPLPSISLSSSPLPLLPLGCLACQNPQKQPPLFLLFPVQIDPNREDKEGEAGETARCLSRLYG
jgi:hypothetical protein